MSTYCSGMCILDQLTKNYNAHINCNEVWLADVFLIVSRQFYDLEETAISGSDYTDDMLGYRINSLLVFVFSWDMLVIIKKKQIERS